MLKNLSLVLLFSIFVSGCGGGGGGSKSSSSAALTTSSKMSSSVTMLSSSSSSMPLSSSSQPSSTPANVITLQADKWYKNKGADLSLNTQGVLLTLKAEYDSGQYTYDPDKSLENATIELIVAVSNEYKVSGAGLQLYAFVDVSPWPTKGDCQVTASADLMTGSDNTISCVLDLSAFNQTANNVGFGLQAIAGLNGGVKLPVAGTVTIKSGRIILADPASSSSVSSSSSNMSSSSSMSISSASSSVASISSSAVSSSSSQTTVALLPISDGSWYADDSVMTEDSTGKTFSVSAGYQGVGYYMGAPVIAMENATVEITVNVSSQLKASGADFIMYIYVQPNGGGIDCPITPNASLTAGADQIISCVLASSVFNQTAADVKFELNAIPGPGAPSGSFLVKGGRIVLP